jgi:hypothetical protein
MVRIDIPAEDIRPEVLRDAIAGRLPRLSPTVAMAHIPYLGLAGAEQRAMLQKSFEDTEVDPLVRAAAVRVYSRTGAEAVPALVQALEDPEERVSAAAAAALGQMGTPEELPALKKITRGGPLLKRRRAFAEALIVHRFGLTGHDAPLPTAEAQAAPAGAGDQTFKSVRPGAHRRALALDGIRKEFPGFDPNEQDLYEIQCGPRLIEVAVDRRCTGSEKRLVNGPALPAIVAYKHVAYDEFVPRLIVFSRPSAERGIELTVTRVNGDPVYMGHGTLSDGFDLVSAQVPGVPAVAIRIRLGSRGVEISGASERRVAMKRTPDPA